MAPAMDYLQELTTSLNKLGWGVYQADHEDANGQYEVNFKYADALTTADRVTFFKMATAQIAKKYGAIATHMPKPFSDRTGSGLHVHFHLADADDRQEPVPRRRPTSAGWACRELAYHFLGGVLHHARALVRRHQPDGELLQAAAARRGPALDPLGLHLDAGLRQLRRQQPHADDPRRRTRPLRRPHRFVRLQSVPGTGRVPGRRARRHRKQARSRPANLGNLYELSLAEIAERGIKTLPQSLTEAIDELKTDEVVRSGLGVIADEFIELKTREWETYDRQVTPWEVNQYLTFF